MPTPKISQPEASELLNVSERTIRDAKSIMREAPQKIEAIERGEKTIHEVKREIKKSDANKKRPSFSRPHVGRELSSVGGWDTSLEALFAISSRSGGLPSA